MLHKIICICKGRFRFKINHKRITAVLSLINLRYVKLNTSTAPDKTFFVTLARITAKTRNSQSLEKFPCEISQRHYVTARSNEDGRLTNIFPVTYNKRSLTPKN